MLLRTLSVAVFVICFIPHSVSAARLYIDPATSTQGLGDTFVATIRIDTEGECINAVHVGLQYSVDSIRAVDFSRGESVMSLWVEEPALDTSKGTVMFSGGTPGGYCGPIQGDPAQTNVVGKVIFSVTSADVPRATIHFTPETKVYVHDGSGTIASLSIGSVTYRIVPTPQSSGNPWLAEVAADTIAPDAFSVDVRSDSVVFGGKYYLVFSTIDKQSGIDHYEIFERGGWKTVTSPYQVRDQSLLGIAGGVQVRAIDKAGNIRLGTYAEDAVPDRQFTLADVIPVMTVIALILVIGGIHHLSVRRRDIETEEV